MKPDKRAQRTKTKIQNPITAKTEHQKDFIRSIVENDITFGLGSAGTGKAQPLDSIVYTPDGPKLMGDIRVGDIVCDPNIGTNTVLQIHPQGEKDIYRIHFNNGDFVECCEDHLWEVERLRGKKVNKKSKHIWKTEILSTKDIMNSKIDRVNTNGENRRNFRIQPSTVSFARRNILIDPYILGVLIGDGCLVTNVAFTSYDNHIVERVKSKLSNDLCICNHSKYAFCIKGVEYHKNALKKELMNLGVYGKRSYEKHIPDDYIYNSIENRLELIRGLLDTDGTVGKRGAVSYCTTSDKLKNDIIILLESVGCICSVSERHTFYTHKGEKRCGRKSYIIHIQHETTEILFSLPRKKERCTKRTKYRVARYITGIEIIGKKLAQCITIDGNHLYVTNNFIKTHNSFVSTGVACEHLLSGKTENIIVTRPFVEAGRGLGFLPGSLEEKLQVWTKIFDQYFIHFLTKDIYESYKSRGIIKFECIEYMRGMNYSGYMILDEAQNASYEQIKLFLTRMDEGSKAIVIGDESQSDLRKTDINEVVNRVKDVQGVGVVRFTAEDICRHDIVGRIIMALT